MIVALSILNISNEDRYEKISDFMKVENNWIHFDVMDGKFVESKTFKYDVVDEVNKYCNLFKDVHLMTYNPGEFLQEYNKAGTNQITFHYESVNKNKIKDLIKEVKQLGMKVGLSIKPSTSVEEIEQYLSELDLVLVMSVEPGKGGQKFIEDSLKKIQWLKERKNRYSYLISVDGGINDKTSKLVKEAGADVIVVGTYLTREKITEEKIIELM